MRLALYNPVSGGSWFGGRIGQARRCLEQLDDVQLLPTVRGGITAQTRRLLTPDVTAVFACGGDGTVSDIAAGMIGSDVPLCIVPCGTTNVLAREFEVPQDPVQAIKMASRSVASRSISTWSVGDRHLVLGAGVGWDANLMHRASPRLKRHLGFAGFFPQVLGLAVTYRFPRLEITGVDANGQDVSLVGTSVLISNTSRYTGSNPAIRGADPSDDLLDVVVLEKAGIANLLAFWTLLTMPFGNPLALDGVRTVQVRSLRVASTATPPPDVQVNGDAAGHLPITVVPSGRVRFRTPA